MSIIDLKLKSYDELIFEITTLITNNYLLQQKVEQQENEIDRLNNIINELEKDINENIKVNDGSIICGLNSNSERKECRVENEAYYNILNKLKELKENK